MTNSLQKHSLTSESPLMTEHLFVKRMKRLSGPSHWHFEENESIKQLKRIICNLPIDLIMMIYKTVIESTFPFSEMMEHVFKDDHIYNSIVKSILNNNKLILSATSDFNLDNVGLNFQYKLESLKNNGLTPTNYNMDLMLAQFVKKHDVKFKTFEICRLNGEMTDLLPYSEEIILSTADAAIDLPHNLLHKVVEIKDASRLINPFRLVAEQDISFEYRMRPDHICFKFNKEQDLLMAQRPQRLSYFKTLQFKLSKLVDSGKLTNLKQLTITTGYARDPIDEQLLPLVRNRCFKRLIINLLVCPKDVFMLSLLKFTELPGVQLELHFRRKDQDKVSKWASIFNLAVTSFHLD
ncbi:unnamed protein product [Ambrosiozyma monospora]|uniref:Unnamed protein product n=1 Tax=Ambrosiozyma monospora TaxID=43982 RepID=A0ACB5TH12_AMBMO|nr:unnamed protein product [Ambrosiozyma monospora]